MQGLRVFSIYKTSAALLVVLAVALLYVLVHDVDLFLQLVLSCLLMLPLVHSVVAKRDFFTPINIFCVLYGMGFALVPLLQRVGWVMSDPAYAHYDASFATRTSLLSIVAILLVYLAYYEGRVAGAVASTLPSLTHSINRGRTIILITLLFLVSGGAFVMLMSQIEVHHFIEYFIYTNVSAHGRGHIAFFASLYLIAGFIAVMGLWSPHIDRRRFFVLSFTSAIVLALLSRSRGQVLVLIFVALVFYNYRVKRMSATALMSALCGMLIFVFLIAQFRGSQNFQATKSNIANTFGGLFEEHQATAVLLSEYAQEHISHFYGQVFIENAVIALIPRKIWPSKPESYGGLAIVDAIVPNRQPGYYYTVGPFAVAYADFGYVGVLISMLMIGFLMRVVYEYLKKNIHHDGMVLWYALFCFSLWAFMRGGFGFMPVILQQTILVIVLYTLIANSYVFRPKNAHMTSGALRGSMIEGRPMSSS